VNVSEETYRRIVEAVPEGIWVVNPEGQTIFSNRRMAELLGVAFETMPEQSCFACVFPEEAEDAQRHFARTLAGDSRPFEFRLRRADGSPIWVSISCRPMYDDAGVPVALLGLFSDISERKKDEAALRGSEERFRALVDTAPVLTWLSGPEKTATYFNSPAMAFAGLPLEQLVGTNYLNLVHPEDREGYLNIIFKAANARAPFSTEVRFRRGDGEYRWLLVSAVPRISDGVYLGHLGTGVDVTDLKRSYEQHLAAQNLESLGVLAAGVAHDFNNLLGAIVGHADCAQCELDANSPAAEDIDRIRVTALRAAEIVSQLMTFARQETAPPEATDLSRLVSEMLDLLRVSISKAAVLHTELAPDLPTILANAAEIRQVVMNLIINASEALLGNPGSITIRTTCATLDGERNGVRLEIEDTGTGMTEEVKARIFDPFFTTRFVGRGLGLSAVQGIVRRHGGSIDVESMQGAGSRFIVLLPCGEKAKIADSTGVSPAAPTGQHGTVLFIDDEDALRSAVAKLLRKRDFHVVEAADGASAIEKFKADPAAVSVVVLDVTMPGMSGREVLEELRRIRPGVNVILSTAYSRETAMAAVEGHTPWGFVRKPYQIDVLIKMLQQAAGSGSTP